MCVQPCIVFLWMQTPQRDPASLCGWVRTGRAEEELPYSFIVGNYGLGRKNQGSGLFRPWGHQGVVFHSISQRWQTGGNGHEFQDGSGCSSLACRNWEDIPLDYTPIKFPSETVSEVVEFKNSMSPWIINITKAFRLGVPFVAQGLANQTRIHGDVGSIPGLARWVGDPALP